MGEVYRARDTKLGREVALKVLPEGFAADAERLVRFQREAQVLASLNHPNIAAIYGLEEVDSVKALVLELVEGPTLADRIADGPISHEEVLPIANQIAEALQAAHDAGVIHRDLKPANIKLRPDSVVKVLDFGLAKAVEAAQAGAALSSAPTLMRPDVSGAGVILGTAAYMSPEQARGRPVDKRSDVWAFGCVLYEMLTRRRAFEGEDVTDTLSRVLQQEPDLTVLPANTPPLLRRLLARCLEKDPNKRLRHVATAGFAIEQATTPESPRNGEAAARKRPYSYLITAAAIALVAALVVAIGVFFSAEAPGPLVKLQLVPPPNSTFGAISVSPDGRMVAFTARDASGRTQLWLRHLDSIDPQPLQATEGASYPFWSPDSQSIGFFAGNYLKRVAVAGGAPRTICELVNARGGARGGTWSREDIILFAAEPFGPEPLFRVSASGGDPRPVSVNVEGHHHWPVFLPDGRRFLFFGGVDIGQAGVYVGSLDSPESRLVIRADTSALLAPASPASGSQNFLLFVRDQTLLAQPVDIDRIEPLGPAVPVADQVGIELDIQRSKFSVSNNGVLAYTSGAGLAQLRWFDLNGDPLAAVGPPGINIDLRLSPGGRSVAVQREDGSGSADIWLYDLMRGTVERFTTHAAYDAAPVWSPDGNHLFFFSTRDGPWSLYRKALSGSREETLVLKAANSLVPLDVSPDGQHLVYTERNPDQTYEDILVTPAFDSRPDTQRQRSLIATRGNDNFARFSPDGRWVAYVSDESGRNEVYVQAFNEDGSPGSERFTISTEGGIEPVWPKRGNRLFYIGPDDVLMVVDVQTAPVFTAGVPRPLFRIRRTGVVGYDADPNGERLLVSTQIDEALSTPAIVVLNWFQELNRLQR